VTVAEQMQTTPDVPERCHEVPGRPEVSAV